MNMNVFLYITTEYKQQVSYFVSKKSKNNIIKDLHYFFTNLLFSSLKDKIKVNKQSESHRVLFWAVTDTRLVLGYLHSDSFKI